MKVAYVLVPHFPVAVERRENPSLKGKALVIGGLPQERKRVYELSSEALEQSVRKGMSLRQAEELCPEAVFLPLREERYTLAFEEMLSALEPFGPLIEPDGLGSAYLEVSGLHRIYGPDERLGRSITQTVKEATGFPVKVGIARGKFTARITAIEAPHGKVVVIAPRNEKRFLRELPVALLPLSREMQERLGMLGIRTMGQFASLPASAILAQFGLEGKRAHQLAQGEDESKVVGRRRQGSQELERRFEDPVREMQILQMTVQQLSAQLLRRLHSRGQIAQRIMVTLEFEGGEREQRQIVMSEPSADERRIEVTIAQLLSRFDYRSRVTVLKISLEGLEQGKGHQLALFPTRTLHKARIDRAVANLVGKYGPDCFLKARLLDLHAVLPERRFTLSPIEGFTLLRHGAALEPIPVKSHYDQALPTSTTYRSHDWR
jgi:DNA polymerase-4